MQAIDFSLISDNQLRELNRLGQDDNIRAELIESLTEESIEAYYEGFDQTGAAYAAQVAYLKSLPGNPNSGKYTFV